MSVKIEILDYKYGTEANLVNVNAGTAGTGWSALSSTSASLIIAGLPGTNNFFEDISSQSLVIGTTYNLSFQVTNYSGNGNIGFSSSSGVPNSARFGGNTDGIQYFTFTATGTSFPDLFGQSSCGGTISNISIGEAVLDWDNSVVGELDVTDHSDFPLAMTFQISDIKDLTSTSGDYSKTFKIPATKNNNKLLKNPYIPNIDTEVNITENKKCRILVNNLFSLTGLIKITGVSGYGETPSHYDCVFFGNNLSWAEGLSNLYMNELNWGTNSEGLEYNKTKIMATWQHEDCAAADTASDPPIVYPVTSYGEFNPDGEQKTIQLLDTLGEHSPSLSPSVFKGYYGFYGDGNFYSTPLPSADWRPAVFVKTTLEKIFSKVGYQISSTFMETDMFKKLVWLLPNFKYNNAEERYDEYSLESNFTNGVSMSNDVDPSENGIQRFYEVSISEDNGTDGGAFYYNGNGREALEISSSNLNITIDGANVVENGVNSYIEIEEYGYYNIRLNGIQSRIARADKGGVAVEVIDRIDSRINLEVKTVGQANWNIINESHLHTVISQGVSQNIMATTDYVNMPSINQEGIWLNKGDRIRITFGIKILAEDDNQNFQVYVFFKSDTTSNFNISLNSEAVDYGQTYDLKDIINKDYKSLDFVKGIAHAFNLKMTTDETTKTVNIEPFDTFYKDYAEAIDWTYKLDRSKQIDDKWIKSDLKRDVLFKYKSDSKDKKVEANGDTWFNGIKDEFPYQETLPKTFEKGESKYENPFFAGTYNTQDQDSSTGHYSDLPFSACLWEEVAYSWETNRPTKGYEFLPRLLYWNKYSPNNVGAGLDVKYATVQTWADTFGFLLANASNTSITSNIYPQATSYNKDDSSSPILSYGNVRVRDYNDATGAYTSYKAGKGLFDTYYKDMFEMFKAKPRLRTVYVDLKVRDIVSLDFTKLIYIDGVYWRINKVVDYQPNKNQSTKVELVEWISLGAFSATAPTFGGNNLTGGIGNTASNGNSNYDLGL